MSRKFAHQLTVNCWKGKAQGFCCCGAKSRIFFKEDRQQKIDEWMTVHTGLKEVGKNLAA